MDDWIKSEEDYILNNKIQERQRILDEGWNNPKPQKRFIGSRRVSEAEWEAYVEHQKEIMRNHIPEERYTSTGEEWEVDSDGEYTPDWLYDK